MLPDQLMGEIRDLNQSFLRLAQALVREDRKRALAELGLSERAGELLAGMSPDQVARAASRNLVLCTLTLQPEDLACGLLVERHAPAAAQPAGAAEPLAAAQFSVTER